MLLLCAACSTRTPVDVGRGSARIVPASSFRTLIAAASGHPVVVNYWATWCDPCKAEMPRLAAAARKYSGRVHFIGVDVQDNSRLAERFAKRTGVDYVSVSDPKREIARKARILGLPVTQFYDASGKRVAIHQGEIKTAELENQISKLLKR